MSGYAQVRDTASDTEETSVFEEDAIATPKIRLGFTEASIDFELIRTLGKLLMKCMFENKAVTVYTE